MMIWNGIMRDEKVPSYLGGAADILSADHCSKNLPVLHVVHIPLTPHGCGLRSARSAAFNRRPGTAPEAPVGASDRLCGDPSSEDADAPTLSFMEVVAGCAPLCAGISTWRRRWTRVALSFSTGDDHPYVYM